MSSAEGTIRVDILAPNAGRNRGGWGRWLLALAASFALGSGNLGAADGQPAAGPQAAFEEAERAFEKGELTRAAQLYRSALDSKSIPVRRRCYDQLLTLGVDRGQYDVVIPLAEEYRAWLGDLGDRNRRREVGLQIGLGYLGLGHYRTAEERFLDVTAAREKEEPLDPVLHLTALTHLARIAELYRDQALAEERWRRVENRAANEIRRMGADAEPRRLIEFRRYLAYSYRFQERHDAALEQLQGLLEIHDKLKDPAGKSKTLQLIADEQTALRRPKEAETALRESLKLREQPEAADLLATADLWSDLARVQAAQRQVSEASESRVRAMKLYQQILTEPISERSKALQRSQAFWNLQQLHQHTQEFAKALSLVETEVDARREQVIPDARLKTEQGYLQVFLGTYGEARESLRDALKRLDKQSPPNLIDLPRTLNSLAIVEQATDGLERAEELAQRCVQLYRLNNLPTDTVLIEAFNLLGTNSALSGSPYRAVERYREGIARCEQLGPQADPLLARIYVNLSLLHKAQGDYKEALRQLQLAGQVHDRSTEKDSPELMFYQCALASLHSEVSELDKSAVLAEKVLERCKQLKITSGVLITTARHCLALKALADDRCGDAERDWRLVLAMQEQLRQDVLRPRTLNYLALCAERQGKPKEARRWYEQSLELQRRNPRTPPTTAFVTRWRLAHLLEEAGQRSEARSLLVQAVELVEAARLETFGDAQQRSSFFAQFTPAFEDLVEWNVRDGRLEEAFGFAVRSRSRALLDQLRLAGIDPRRDLSGPRGEELRRQEAALLQKLTALRANLQLIPASSADEERPKKLLAELTQAQQEYAGVWREILNASPSYRSLSSLKGDAEVLQSLRRDVLHARDLLLCYYLGQERSFLFLIGPADAPVQVLPLTLQQSLSSAVAKTVRQYAPSDTDTRGIILRLPEGGEGPKPPKDPKEPVQNKVMPLNLEDTRALVDAYRVMMENPRFGSKRGILLNSKEPDTTAPTAPPLASLRGLTGLADVFLPAAVKERIARDKVETLVVIPDGALHKLPLEALIRQVEPEPRFVLDDFPPILYAPSAAALTLWADRPALPARATDVLLTACNPAYPQPEAKADPKSSNRLVIGLKGQLPLLPGTAEESKRIRKLFAPDRTVALEGPQATEAGLREAIAKYHPPILHVAAHGFADESFGNIFGALALTPPAKVRNSEDDGFLSLHEIYRLPLQDCRLAILSACQTNVGPQAPLEAGVTLASAFLTAGARRVVASHWSVDDASTAELMAVFLEELRKEGGDSPSYSRALHRARLKVKSTERWSSPYYWAPFVLVGAPDR